MYQGIYMYASTYLWNNNDWKTGNEFEKEEAKLHDRIRVEKNMGEIM